MHTHILVLEWLLYNLFKTMLHARLGHWAKTILFQLTHFVDFLWLCEKGGSHTPFGGVLFWATHVDINACYIILSASEL